MINKLYIDGGDAYEQFGVFITEGSYPSLLQYPAMKPVGGNDWAEEDGIEADLMHPALDTRNIDLLLGCDRPERYGHFLDLLSDGAFHRFDFRELGRTYNLRLLSQPELALRPDISSLSLQFADDFPVPSHDVAGPVYTDATSEYDLDDTDLAQYGISILEGSENQILKTPAVKSNLLRTWEGQPGALYDGERVVFATKDVALECLMRADTLAEFWQNYDSFLRELSKPGERLFYTDRTGYYYPCYYKSCGTKMFTVGDKVRFQFTLTLTFTSFRAEADEYLLVTQGGAFLMTEDNQYAIDLQHHEN